MKFLQLWALLYVIFQVRCDKVHHMRHGAFELVDFSNATINLDGSKECVNTTGMIEMYDKKPIHECTHKNEEQCHHTYVTQFEPIQEEECDVHYQKSCQVTYYPVVINETHRHCYEPLVRKCEGEPSTQKTICKDWPETYCSTKYIPSNLTAETKFVSDTKCERIYTEVCVPVNCAMVPGEELCHDDTRPSVQERPEENCELIPFKQCVLKTKLVPRLKAVPICTQVPREICTIKYIRGEKIQKEVVSIWCRPISDDDNDESSDYDLMDSASDIESTTIFVEYDTDFIPTTTAEPELATYPINLPGYGDDDKEEDLLPGYGEDGGDENLSGYGEDSTETANLGDDDNLPKYEEDEDQSNPVEAQLLPNYSESDNSLANYNENSQEAAAPDAYLPPEGNSKPIANDYAPPDAEAAPDAGYTSPNEGSEDSKPITSDYAPPSDDGSSSVGAPQGYLSPIGDSLPAYGSAEELPNYIVEDSIPLNNNYAAPNGYLSPIDESDSKPISDDYAGPSNAEQAPDGYSPPNEEEVQGSQPIATDYAPPSTGESAPNGYLPPIVEDDDKEPSKAEGYSYPVPDNSLELPERPQNQDQSDDDEPIANDYAGPNNAESAAPDAGYLPPIDESQPLGSGYTSPDSESAPNGYLPPLEESSQENAKPITGDYAGPSDDAESAPEAGYLPPIEDLQESESVGNDYIPPPDSNSNAPSAGYLPPIDETAEASKPITNDYSGPSDESDSAAPSNEYLPPIPVYGSANELPNYIIEDTVSLLPSYNTTVANAAANGYLPPLSDNAGESAPNDYSPPSIDDSQPISDNYKQPNNAAEQAPDGYLQPEDDEQSSVSTNTDYASPNAESAANEYLSPPIEDSEYLEDLPTYGVPLEDSYSVETINDLPTYQYNPHVYNPGPVLDSYLPSYQDAANLPPPPPIKRNRNRFTNRASGNNNRYRQSGSGNQPVYSKPGPFVQVPAYHSASFSSLHPIYLPLFRDQFQSRNSKPRRHNQKRRPQQKQQRRRQNQPRQIHPRQIQPRHIQPRHTNQPRRHHPRRLPK